jgi:hypothetical protein
MISSDCLPTGRLSVICLSCQTEVLGYLDDDNWAWCVTNGQHSYAICLSCKWNTNIFLHFQVRCVVEVVRSFFSILPIILAYFTSKEEKKLSGSGG